MSWKVINEILGLAIADADFYEELRRDPLKAIQIHGFPLLYSNQSTQNPGEMLALYDADQRIP